MSTIPEGRTRKYWQFRWYERCNLLPLSSEIPADTLTFQENADLLAYYQIRQQERDDDTE
jgi:hypothetical protein